MIQRLGMLHYLTEATYPRVYAALGLDPSQQKDSRNFPGEPLCGAQMYHIEYQAFGHIWFLHVDLDFPRFACDYDEFPAKLYEVYAQRFGATNAQTLAPYEDLNCDYVEYAARLPVEDPQELIDGLRARCAPEQLDKTLWTQYHKPHSTIEFCMAAQDGGLEVLARCHGSALKARVKDRTLHRATGLTPAAVVNAQTEAELLAWLCRRHGLPLR